MIDLYTDNTNAGIVSDAFRFVLSYICKAIFVILTFLYQIMFTIAMSDFLSGQTVRSLFGRVQLILGVFISFRLLIVLLNGIVNPDTFTDKKNGFGSIITRVIVSLVLLVAVMPISIPNASNTFEKHINNNGILFGVLDDLQYRVLKQNLLGKIILGTTDDNTVSQMNNLSSDTNSNLFATNILKQFIHINLVPADKRTNPSSSNQNVTSIKSNWMCQNIENSFIKLYNDNSGKVTVGDILTLAHADGDAFKCDYGDLNSKVKDSAYTYSVFFHVKKKAKKYKFTFDGILAIVFGGISVLLLAAMCMDIAKRTLKMAILRLIAPIPIISNISTKSDNGMLQKWTQMLITTYVNLFIDLGIIYFAIYIITDIMQNGLSFATNSNVVVQTFSTLLIILALLFFAKEAPKFISDSLGLKEGSLSGMLKSGGQLLAAGAIMANLPGTAIRNAQVTHEENKQLHEQDLAENGGRPNAGTRLKQVLRSVRHVGGAFGTAAAVMGGFNAASDAKDHQSRAAAQSMRNAMALRQSHSTSFGRTTDNIRTALTGRSRSVNDSEMIELYQEADKEISGWKDAIKSEAIKNGAYGHVNISSTGGADLSRMKFDATSVRRIVENATGPVVKIQDNDGNTYDVFTREIARKLDSLDDSQAVIWQTNKDSVLNVNDVATAEGLSPDKTYKASIGQSGKLNSKYVSFRNKVGKLENARLTYNNSRFHMSENYSDLGAQKGDVSKEVAHRNASMRSIMNRANSAATGNSSTGKKK